MSKQLIAFDIGNTLFGSHPQTAPIRDDPAALLSQIIPNIYVFATILLFVYAVVGGFMMVASAGNTDQAGKGKQAVTNAILGFVIVFASYWIIQLISFITDINILGGYTP